MNITCREEVLPLTPQAQHVLLALMVARQSGYGIKQLVAKDSTGLVDVGNGTVYRLLNRLVRVGYVNTVEGGRMGLYELTTLGECLLEMEISRQRTIAELYHERQTVRVARQNQWDAQVAWTIDQGL